MKKSEIEGTQLRYVSRHCIALSASLRVSACLHVSITRPDVHTCRRHNSNNIQETYMLECVMRAVLYQTFHGY